MPLDLLPGAFFLTSCFGTELYPYWNLDWKLEVPKTRSNL